MYKKIFVPVDNSEHSMASIDVAVELAKRFDAEVVGSHDYAARMHDYRFKQMEFTLPEEYLVEDAMEKQRKIHDTLITMGHELISDSYLVVADKRCKEAGVPFQPKMYDGKNWKAIVQDSEGSDYDLRILGAVELALWDLAAQCRGVPLCKLLFEHPAERVNVYASGINSPLPWDLIDEHLACGVGEQFGIGAELARREARVLFEELRARVDSIERVGEVERVRATMTPAVKRMPVRLSLRRSS